MVAPIVLTLIVGVFDVATALVVWEETCNAASAIAQAAEKLSVTTGSTLTSLTSTQMQNAMTSIYAQIPGLSLGNGTGMFTGSFSVTLSGVVYLPLCQTSSGCAAQTPYTLWSTYLTQGGSKLIQTSSGSSSILRACGKLTAVSQFPSGSSRLTTMLDPTKTTGATSMTLTPQVVADVQYVFTPFSTLFLTSITFWASATFPAPLGGTDQEITFNTTAPTGSVVSCNPPN